MVVFREERCGVVQCGVYDNMCDCVVRLVVFGVVQCCEVLSLLVPQHSQTQKYVMNMCVYVLRVYVCNA